MVTTPHLERTEIYLVVVWLYISLNISSMLLEMIYAVLILKFHTSSDKFLVGVIYRPHQSCAEYWEKFSATMEQALDTEYKLFLVGDFNVNMLASGNNTFKTLLQCLNIYNVVTCNKPTNFVVNSGSYSCIDLALTNDVQCIENVIVDEPICSSHSPVTIHLSFKIPKQKAYKRVIKNYNLANYQGLNADLTLVDWDEEVFNQKTLMIYTIILLKS